MRYARSDVTQPCLEICKAWLSATGLPGYPEYRTLVSFNNTPHILEALREADYRPVITVSLSSNSNGSPFAK